MFCRWTTLTLLLTVTVPGLADDDVGSASIPAQLSPWLQPQNWVRDSDGPVIELGQPSDFDDTHVLSPCVAKINGSYHLWYSGARGAVADRVFDLGLATSSNGRSFQKDSANPVFRFGDGRHSVVTATLLRNSDGTPLREDGQLRMSFTAADLTAGTGRHSLHETRSDDGINWSQPSEPLLQHVYAPTILKDGELYRMWYTDVSGDEWTFRMATSSHGRQWQVYPDPVLRPQAGWESKRLFYPTVLKIDDVYLMWYGSYWSERRNTTAIGFAVSLDGHKWYRNIHSPVLRPDPQQPWESHYTTSQSIIRNSDGSFRIWYASRKQPPFVNKYFAINTATWKGLKSVDNGAASLSPSVDD